MSKIIKKSTLNNGNSNVPIVIVNPKSASGSTKNNWSGIASDLSAHFGAFNVAFTKAQGDGIRLARRSIETGRKFIIACGGDGTINEIVNGIMETGEDVEFGVMPSGTGGDFRRTIGMSNIPREAARELRTGETKLVDVGKVSFLNHKNEQTSRYFLNVSSFGLSVSINERVKEQDFMRFIPGRAVRGKANFALSTLQEVLENDIETVRVKIDDQEEKTIRTINFAVANSRFFGGGMKIAPGAIINDGYFDVINIGDIRTLKILMNAYKLYGGSHLDLEEVKSTRAKRIEVSPVNKDDQIYLETDGELPGKLPAVYEILPKALKVRVPRNSK